MNALVELELDDWLRVAQVDVEARDTLRMLGRPPAIPHARRPWRLDVSVREAGQGNAVALARVLSTARPFVVHYCRARIGRRDGTFASADLAAGQVLHALLRALPRYRERSFLAFVYRLAAREVAGAGQGCLDGMFAVLSDRQREVMVLRVLVGLSTEETAEALGSTPSAIRMTQHKALSRLRMACDEARQPVPAAGPSSRPSTSDRTRA
jgi:RNA polymerase sigma-70 factor, ECF subfamily